MDGVNVTTAKALVRTQAVNRAIIQCFDGRRWKILLRGKEDFVLKSERKNPKPFVKLETAIEEIKGLGLRRAEIDFQTWDRDQATLLIGGK